MDRRLGGDVAGNTAYVTNTLRLTVVTNAVYAHDPAGCVTSIVSTGAGYTQAVVLTWNSQYQLAAVSTNGIECERNGYDALGRRVWTWDGTTTNFMVYDGIHLLAEVDSAGGLRRAYTRGPGIDNWLSMTVYTGATVKTYFYITDHLGTVHALADETGAIVESYRFDAWGRVLGAYNGSGARLKQSAVGNRILFQGRELSWQTGLYFFRARWADPVVGRWLSPDPIGISGGLNMYVMMGNNLVNRRDPFGLFQDDEFAWLRTSPNAWFPLLGQLPSGYVPYYGSDSAVVQPLCIVLNAVQMASNLAGAAVDALKSAGNDPLSFATAMVAPQLSLIGASAGATMDVAVKLGTPKSGLPNYIHFAYGSGGLWVHTFGAGRPTTTLGAKAFADKALQITGIPIVFPEAVTTTGIAARNCFTAVVSAVLRGWGF